jgi:3'(2'), 5'-bisphosphate nucleotidase
VTFPTPAMDVDRDLADALASLVAGAAVFLREAASATFEVSLKSDGSPVTSADLAADGYLAERLARLLPGVAVVSEERMPPSSWRCPDIFVLVDPLDGTKEFIAGRPEYAVNLAVVVDRRPVAGFIAVPALGCVYRGVVGRGAERLTFGEHDPTTPLAVAPVRVRAAPAAGLVALTSRSHHDADTDAFLARLAVTERHSLGSALKFCRIAEGAADVYPRLASTREWDIAAGQALVEAAGGRMTGGDGGTLSYGYADRDFVVPSFVAWGGRGDAG